MKKTYSFLLVVMVAIAACNLLNPYGKKVNINSKSEVYLKGEGVTEAEATKLGNYLLKIGFFDDSTQKSVQLLKDSTYVVKFVVDAEALKQNPSAEVSFMAIQMLITDSVFNGNKVRVVLADSNLKDIKTVGQQAIATSDTTTIK
jgi:hypothetical protein